MFWDWKPDKSLLPASAEHEAYLSPSDYWYNQLHGRESDPYVRRFEEESEARDQLLHPDRYIKQSQSYASDIGKVSTTTTEIDRAKLENLFKNIPNIDVTSATPNQLTWENTEPTIKIESSKEQSTIWTDRIIQTQTTEDFWNWNMNKPISEPRISRKEYVDPYIQRFEDESTKWYDRLQQARQPQIQKDMSEANPLNPDRTFMELPTDRLNTIIDDFQQHQMARSVSLSPSGEPTAISGRYGKSELEEATIQNLNTIGYIPEMISLQANKQESRQSSIMGLTSLATVSPVGISKMLQGTDQETQQILAPAPIPASAQLPDVTQITGQEPWQTILPSVVTQPVPFVQPVSVFQPTPTPTVPVPTIVWPDITLPKKPLLPFGGAGMGGGGGYPLGGGLRTSKRNYMNPVVDIDYLSGLFQNMGTGRVTESQKSRPPVRLLTGQLRASAKANPKKGKK